jgi:hypothetical protein
MSVSGYEQNGGIVSSVSRRITTRLGWDIEGNRRIFIKQFAPVEQFISEPRNKDAAN